MITSLITSSSSPLTLRDLDNACFLDWIAMRAGYWIHPRESGLCRVELDRGAVLRVTGPVFNDPVSITMAEMQQHGTRRSGLTVRRMRPAAPLAQLRRRAGAQRMLLETELQRRRLYPLWIDWMVEQTQGEYDVRDSDCHILRYLPKARFDDLVVVAQLLPSIGPGLMWSLFRLSVTKATRLFARWAAAGEHERFRHIGDAFEEILVRYRETRLLTQLLEVNALMADHGYARRVVK